MTSRVTGNKGLSALFILSFHGKPYFVHITYDSSDKLQALRGSTYTETGIIADRLDTWWKQQLLRDYSLKTFA